ncbi:hypothetical protein [Aquitalea magnusonii]|uniref:hypothetical protein n=1 Tax=Aquitalea magnusonii TaxID=332411 RepID=UPI0011AE191C|nr:hypothetical protein [Aquitalea magnusonii]
MMKVYEFSNPTERNGYCLFDDELERNPLVFFHATPKKNIESIINNGFKFGPTLQSISYANRSSSCLAHRGRSVAEDYAVFVVEFASLDNIKINPSDIHVYREDIQPIIKGYCIVPKEYIFS